MSMCGTAGSGSASRSWKPIAKAGSVPWWSVDGAWASSFLPAASADSWSINSPTVRCGWFPEHRFVKKYRLHFKSSRTGGARQVTTFPTALPIKAAPKVVKIDILPFLASRFSGGTRQKVNTSSLSTSFMHIRAFTFTVQVFSGLEGVPFILCRSIVPPLLRSLPERRRQPTIQLRFAGNILSTAMARCFRRSRYVPG